MTIDTKAIRAAAEADNHGIGGTWVKAATVIALLDRLEAAEKDAARYQWLLVNAYVGIAKYPKPHEVWCLRLPNPVECNSLNAAIDAAMKGQK